MALATSRLVLAGLMGLMPMPDSGGSSTPILVFKKSATVLASSVPEAHSIPA